MKNRLLIPLVLVLFLTACSDADIPSASASTANSSLEPTPSASESTGYASPSTSQWPAEVDQVTAYSGLHESLSVVWIYLEKDIEDPEYDKVAASVTTLGYNPSPTPLMCQQNAFEPLGVGEDGSYTFGLALFFANRVDADTFVSLYGKPVLAVVDGAVFCDFG